MEREEKIDGLPFVVCADRIYSSPKDAPAKYEIRNSGTGKLTVRLNGTHVADDGSFEDAVKRIKIFLQTDEVRYPDAPRPRKTRQARERAKKRLAADAEQQSGATDIT